MAVSFVHRSTSFVNVGYGSGPATLSGVTIADGDKVVVGLMCYFNGTKTVNALTANSGAITFTPIGSTTAGSDVMYLFYADTSGVTSLNLSATLSGSTRAVHFHVVSVTGAPAGAPSGSYFEKRPVTNQDPHDVDGGLAAPSNGGLLLVVGEGNVNAIDWTAGATELGDTASADGGGRSAVAAQTSAANVTIKGNGSGGTGYTTLHIANATFDPASSGTPTGLATATDSAFALAGKHIRTVGLAADAVTAFALSPKQVRATGLASDASAAFALGSARPAGVAAEVASSLSLGGRQIRAAGLAIEADSALALGGKAVRPVGISTEAAFAFALSAGQANAVGLSIESASALGRAGIQKRPAGLANEAASALALGGKAVRPVGLSTEAAAALALNAGQANSVGLAIEVASALGRAGIQKRAAGISAETNFALSLGSGSASPVGLAAETNAALGLSGRQARSVGVAVEAAQALLLIAVQRMSAGLSIANDNALPLMPRAPDPVPTARRTTADGRYERSSSERRVRSTVAERRWVV